MPNWNTIKSQLKFKDTDITTGYYAQLSNYLMKNYFPIPISIVPPKWFPKKYLKDIKLNLSPTHKILTLYKNNDLDEESYINMFYEDVLNKNNINHILNQLTNISNKIVLLCYEKPFNFCHRHIVSYWLSQKLGFEICELTL